MYNLHIDAHQTMEQCLVRCSLSETDDRGSTYAVASFGFSCAERFEALEPGSLEEFLEQMVTGLVKGLSTRTGSILSFEL